MAENRINRETTTREKETRKTAWQRPEIGTYLILVVLVNLLLFLLLHLMF